MRRLVDLPSSRLHKERSRLELGMAFSLTQHNFFDEKKMWAEPARLMGVDGNFWEWVLWEFLRMLMYFCFVLYCFYILGNVRDFQS